VALHHPRHRGLEGWDIIVTMEVHMRVRLAVSVAAVALASVLSAPAAAQWIKYPTPGVPRLPDGKPNISAPAPKTADGKPDLTGIWLAGRAGQYKYDYNVALDQPPELIQPAAQALRRQRVQDFRKDSPLAHCLPVSVPFLDTRGMSRIVQTPGLIVIMYESPNSPHRTIFTDGRGLPEEMSPTWLGYSVGRWEGDTLVVTTAGFNDKGWLDVGGLPQTETLRLTERYRRPDFGHMEMDLTFDDPKTFAKPFSLHMVKNFVADTEILEDVCDNEKDSPHYESAVKVPQDVLSKYAGTYQLASGRDLVVSVSGDQLLIKDNANPLDALFVAVSQNGFMSSVSQVAVEFAKDGQSFMRSDRGREEKATRKR
jgi:hypothetical protein